MPAKATPLPFRHDTLLGVCEGLGRDLHVHPNILRIAFAMLLLWNPVMVVGTYLVLGLVLALVHWLVPDVRAEAPVVTAAPSEALNELPLAA